MFMYLLTMMITTSMFRNSMATSLGKRVLSVKDIVRRQAAADNGGLSEGKHLNTLLE
jgi:hypothetical protein